jgi:hypothetical protein
LTILFITSLVWIFDIQRKLSWLHKRHESMVVYAGEEGDPNVTAALENLAARLAETSARTERLVTQSKQIEDALAHTVQGVGLVRFRAFEDTGGDQSFALALADGEGNGIVMSALYGRGKTRVYAKPVQSWLSPRPLGEEEEQALAEARKIVVGAEKTPPGADNT